MQFAITCVTKFHFKTFEKINIIAPKLKHPHTADGQPNLKSLLDMNSQISPKA